MLTYVKYDFLVLITIKVIMKNCVVTGLSYYACTRSLSIYKGISLFSKKHRVLLLLSSMRTCSDADLTSAAAESREKQQKRKWISAALISPVVQMCPSAGETFPTGAAKMLQPA